MKIQTDMQMPDFEILAADGKKMMLSSVYKKNEHTLLLFLRYYGCTLCQLDLKTYKEVYDAFSARKTEIIIVLQSKPATISASGAAFPFIIACDPEQKQFKEFEIVPAKNMLGMLSLKLLPKIKRAKAAGLEHGAYEGEEKQLPAAFLMDHTGRVIYQRYAKNLTDLPTPQEFLSKI